jgi:GGDEF domain-containing protein
MTTAPDHLVLGTTASVPAVDDVPSLLPSRVDLLARLAERLPSADADPVAVFLVGLGHGSEDSPVAQSTVAQVTSLIARSVRHDDWLGSCGPAEVAVLLRGGETAAKTAAERLVRAIAALHIPGLSATAGVAALSVGLTAAEVFRRAALSLQSARQVGPGTVIRYRDPR